MLYDTWMVNYVLNYSRIQVYTITVEVALGNEDTYFAVPTIVLLKY